MLQSLRIFKSKAGVFTDFSISNQEKESAFIPELSAANFLYIAQPNPFNNFHIWSKVANDQNAKLKIEYWSGNGWTAMTDIMDATAVGGKTLARNGVVIFSPNPDRDWKVIEKSQDNETLSDLRIYDSYWLRISTDSAINVLTEIEEFSYSFTNSDNVSALDSEIDQYMENIKEGKTEWTEEILTASKIVISDLKRHNIIKNVGQLIKIEDVELATTYKTLMIIYKHLGRSFLEKLNDTRKDYDKALSFGNYTVDKNKNARIDIEEQEQKQNRLLR